MIKFYDGNIFNVGAECIVNTVNIEGVMGAGLAYEIKLRFPEVYDEYLKDCKENKVNVGKLNLYKDEQIYILNFPTKISWRYPSKYEFIEKGLQYFLENFNLLIIDNNIKSIAFPKLGAGKGCLNWINVKKIMEKYLSKLETDIDIYICLDELNFAEGVEKKMVNMFNEYSDVEFSEKLGLNKIQVENINKKRPIKRFCEINKIDKIGKRTYEKLHMKIYNLALNGEIKKQLTFFD